MATSSYSLTIRDYANELSRFRVNIAQITAGNIVAQQAAMDALSSATQGVIIGVRAKEDRTLNINSLANNPPSSPLAQRENKWLALSNDNVTNKLFRNEIPTADLTLLTNNSEIITVFPAGVLATFKTAWEALVVSEDGNPCTLISLQYVGKRL